MKVCEVKSVREAVDVMAQAHPETAFLIDPLTGATVCFQELKQQSLLLAAMLHHAGLKKGDKVAFLMDNGLLTAQLFIGVMYGGYVAVPLNVRAGAVQLSYMLDHCDAKVVFVEDQYSVLLRDAAGDVRHDIRVITANVDGPLPAFESAADSPIVAPLTGEDEALLMYSSGSTGKSKGAIHTHSSILAHGRNSIEAHQLSSADRSLLVLPLYHINAECVTLIPTLLSGGSVVVAHRFDVSRFWDWVDDLHITWSALVPTIISELVDWDDPGKDRRQAAFQRIRFFRSSSAPLSPSLHQQFLDKFDLPLLQAMGSTEGGNVFSNPVPPGKNKIGSPGLPWGFEARIVDREGANVPPGESGEVLLRGAGMMREYYKDSEGTAAVLDSDGWLHTGDLARQDEDGYFFVVGRSKELIIKGGVNIAPRQIDEVLESHPAVLEAAAVGVPDRYLGEDAVAFVVLRSDVAADERELLAFCETRLGHFKTPSRIHFLRELPKGPSGKVQRLKLLDPSVLAGVAVAAQPGNSATGADASGRGNQDADRSSTLSVEQIIAAAWAEVLAVPQVDYATNFFALGGHSLLAIQCLSKLREKLPVILTLPDFFEFNTVAEQADLVRRRLREASSSGLADASANWEQALLQQYVPAKDEAIPHVDSLLPRPLSPAQQRLWFMEQMNPGVPVYNEAEAVHLSGELNVAALERALNQIVARHELLRSTIRVIEDVPHAVVHESWPLRFKTIDLSALHPENRQAEVDRLLIDEPRVPYDLEAEPGIRVALLRLNSSEHVLILMMHHIICDWSSEGIFWRELSALYRSFATGATAALPALPVTHADYASWKQEQLTANSFADSLAFWEETLKDAPALLELPADRPRPPIMSYQGGRLRWKLNSTLTEALRGTSRQEKTSLFTIFAAALNTLLYRYTGSEDILLGIPLADRDLPELQSVIGFLLHVHVLRTRISRDTTFRELLTGVRKGTMDLYAHRSVPFEQIVHKVGQERTLAYSPLFQVMLNWRDRDQLLPFIGLEGLAIDSLIASANTSKFDLLLFATDSGDEIWLELEYNADLFDEDRIHRMLGHFQTILESVVDDPGETLDSLSILTANERHQILYEWNDTSAEFPADKCVHELFEEQAAKTPDAMALSFDESQLTYSELNRRANQLAHYLRELGVVPDARVAVCVERGFEMVIAVLAVLKAGGAYVPLDPAYPVDRLQFMLDDAKPVALITQAHLKGMLTHLDGGLPVLNLAPSSCAWDDRPETNPAACSIGLTSIHLAYVMYTSGSTGQPKGVMGLHRATVNRFFWMYKKFPFEPGEVCCARASLSFVDSIWELFGPLSKGIPVILIPSTQSYDLANFALTIARKNITRLLVVPSLLQAFLHAHRSEEISLPELKYWITSGEALPISLANDFLELFPKGRLLNLYGSSEDAGDVTCYEVTSVIDDTSIPIGRPIANAKTYILDPRRQPVPVGVPGELYIGGAGLARGYFNLADLTRERFVDDPFSDEPKSHIFRTGDLARWLPDGNVEYLGRNDYQVKIRGFRIELGEIEAAVEQGSGVRQCVITVQGDGATNKRLVAHIVPADPRKHPTIDHLRSELKQRLPDYMVPAHFLIFDKLPMTPNGKVDRKTLTVSTVIKYSGDAMVAAPRDSIESGLVNIWEQLLEVRPIGIRTSFFDAGGHSLLVVKMFARIGKQFNRTLPIAAIFASPTIEQLATLLRGRSIDMASTPIEVSKNLATANSSIVPIRPNGSLAPLFIIHGVEGHIIGFYQLAMLIGTDHPVYGIQAQSILAGQPALLRLEDQAAYYLSEIRKIQPKGPYYLLGYCFGGTVAFEIAHQLNMLGEHVELLGLLDTAQRDCVVRTERNDQVGNRVRRRIRLILDNFASLPFREKAIYLPKRLLTRTLRYIYGTAPSVGIRTVPSFMKNGEEICRMAVVNYRSRPWPGPVTLFRASVQQNTQLPEDLGWSSFAQGGVEVCEVPGNHYEIFVDPNVRVLAERIRERLVQLDVTETPLHEHEYSVN